MTHFLYVVRHGDASPHDGPLSPVGEQQAKLTGQRLKDIPFSAICHGPLPRAAQTASLIAAFMPDVPVTSSDLAGDYLPSDPARDDLPASYARFLGQFSDTERSEGPKLAAAAIRAFTQAGPEGKDNHTLIVTHNLLIGWLVSQALAAPAWRWLGINQMNCALTVIAYQPGLPPSPLTFNDARHLPAELRWTGFPAGLRPAHV
ncbi:MAG TPA: histidine phosphatase family protein [Streptosporangiaceae bacterium]|nr:histidine phosphatase family protein [Streptosporangiaceae bacterium]